MKLAISSLALLMFGFSCYSSAGVLLEPYVGYDTGSTTSTIAGSQTYTTSGASYGAKLGYQGAQWMFGADYLSGSWSMNSTPNATTITPGDIGAFVGFQGAAWRGYVEYIVSATDQYSFSGSTDTYTGSGFKAGVGYKFKPWLALNVEYISNTFTKDSNGSLANNISDSLFGASLSFPFNL
jgi:hypothetical protein